METSTTEIIGYLMQLLLIVIGTGMIAGTLAKKLHLPDVALFILAGMLIGPGLHWIHESDSSLTNQLILITGSVLILFDGGRNIRLHGLRQVGWTVGLLSVPGVLVTVAVVGTAIHWLFGLEWLYAFLCAAVIASTDPASIIPVFRQVRIRERVRETVESESAFNDATGSILTFALLAAATGKSALDAGSITLDFLKTGLGGIAVGCALGYAVSFAVSHFRFGLLRDYTTIAMLGTAIGAYAVGEMLHVSGYMATFAAGLIWGNSSSFNLHMGHKQEEMGHYLDNMTVLLRMLIFILLGSQVDFGVMAEYLWQSVLAIIVLMFVARPIAVLLCALPDVKSRWTLKEMAFMMWVRETGVIPAALAGMLAGLGVKHANVISSVTFMAVMLTIVLQASTTSWMARKLGITVTSHE
ncbi:sodium:proton antiporter [Paenibacillus rhizovicinus]|uniref:Sodium:proton antiporter n=1 Tax=Paenibacillus rhizovicinus TaxID=2704463 RepID=A0A6C0P2K9_9BACL|nr:cation:proton antiporter [Paenibacillus rhizovicinus]QHW32800.1 sodium:proton antiporter [Paenibacillus rhizovicinus]